MLLFGVGHPNDQLVSGKELSAKVNRNPGSTTLAQRPLFYRFLTQPPI